MKREILLATRNQNKKRELEEILHNLNIKIITLDDIASIPEIEEDQNSFEENALKKARITSRLTGYTCLADDSGLEVEALGGQPGIYSARFAGEGANDEQNNEKLLKMMDKVDKDRRKARFVCVIAVSDPGGNVLTLKGICEGSIACSPSGQGGFGYDPLFIPQGFSKSFAELTAEEKNSISHRGRALNKLKPVIEKVFDC